MDMMSSLLIPSQRSHYWTRGSWLLTPTPQRIWQAGTSIVVNANNQRRCSGSNMPRLRRASLMMNQSETMPL